MFYVSSRKGNNVGIKDTKDGVEEFYPLDFVLKQAKQVEIDGVDLCTGNVCIVKPSEVTVKLFRDGNYHLAISTMSIFNNTVGLKFESKPTKDELTFVSKQVLNISRSGINSYSFDLGSSKSYRSGLVIDDILIVMERFSNWKLVDCKKGRY